MRFTFTPIHPPCNIHNCQLSVKNVYTWEIVLLIYKFYISVDNIRVLWLLCWKLCTVKITIKMGRSRSRSKTPRKHHKSKHHKRSKSRDRSERSSSSHSKSYKNSEKIKDRTIKSRYDTNHDCICVLELLKYIYM